MKNGFIGAIHSKSKIRLTFHSKEDGRVLTRTCAPMDYGPSTRALNQSDRYHSWDYDSDTKRHTLSLLPEQVIRIEVLRENFDPGEFVTWQPNWIVVGTGAFIRRHLNNQGRSALRHGLNSRRQVRNEERRRKRRGTDLFSERFPARLN